MNNSETENKLKVARGVEGRVKKVKRNTRYRLPVIKKK